MVEISNFSLILCFVSVAASATCRGGGVLDPSGKLCYIVGKVLMSFGDAEKTCNQYNGYRLATITNMVDNNFVAQLSRHAYSENVFIGATDITPDGSWEWVDGTRMTFMNWAAAPKLGSCAAMRIQDGRWIRENCDEKLSFICYGPAQGAPTDKPTTPKPTTSPIYREGQFLFFMGDAEFLGDPNNKTDISDVYNKERDFIQAVGDHMFTNNQQGNLICSVLADQSWYGWAPFQQDMSDGYPEDQNGFDSDMNKLNFSDFTYQMNNITTAITGLQSFHWYPAPGEFGYTTLIFFTGNQNFLDVPSLFDPFPFGIDEILVVLMNGSPMPVPTNNSKVTKVSISTDFNQNDLQFVTNALKCH